MTNRKRARLERNLAKLQGKLDKIQHKNAKYAEYGTQLLNKDYEYLLIQQIVKLEIKLEE